MNRLIRLLFLWMAWLFPAISFAIAPLPLTDLAATNAAMGVPLKGLLEDYAALLPSQHRLTILEPEQGFASHSWSRNYDALATACRADLPACQSLLLAQFDVLLAELNKADPKAEVDLRRVLLMSAEYDLCQLSGDTGYRCNSPNLLTWVSVFWRQLGYEHLFLAYQDADLAYRNQWNNWVDTQRASPAEKQQMLKHAERDKAAPERDAYTFELCEKLSSAYSLWLGILWAQQSNPQEVLVSLSNLSRLAALQGQMARAEQWWQLTETVLAEYPELKEKNQCLLKSQRFVVDVEQAQSARAAFAGAQRIQELIAQDCPFTMQTLHFALRSLRQQQTLPALNALKSAQAECSRLGRCAHDRQQQISTLIAIAEGKSAVLRSEAQSWQKWLRHQEELLGNERQIVWILADQLHAAGAGVDAAALYESLDESVEFGRSQLLFNNPADLAQYDELKRIRVRSDLEQGKQILPIVSESLRAQGLLRRLRIQRWMKELVKETDAAAQTELDKKLQFLHALQAIAPTIPKLPPLMQTIAKTMLEDAERSSDDFQLAYLDKLAAKKMQTEGFSGSSGLYLYKTAQESAFVTPAIPFEKDEAYLSWLRVPGGYVGTLLASNPRAPNHYLFGAHNVFKQHFISFSAHDEAILQLYRDLLQSGATMSRGLRRTDAIETDSAGLMLKGLPVWQQADGTFVVSVAMPANAARVKDFASLSDALFQRLLAPFAEHYQDATRLIVSPDGALSYLPFETLTRHGVSVLETVDIGYVQSLEVYAELKKRSATKQGKPATSLLSVANPQYGAPSASANQTGTSLGELSWPLLPGTKKESDAISNLYHNKRQLLGVQASKTELAKQSLKDFQILHFATHGYVDDERSALVLSPDSNPMSAYLMDQDIVKWTLDSDLILLSACNTGIGRQQKGEGVVGLPYAFFMAGNINTLMSLWPVDDAGTAALMPAFMQRIQKGEDHINALNNTKRAFARGDYGQALKNPRVWGAFVLYGIPLAESAR